MKAADLKSGKQYVLQVPTKSTRFPNLVWDLDRFRRFGTKAWLVTVQNTVEMTSDTPGFRQAAIGKPVPGAVISLEVESAVRTRVKLPDDELLQLGLQPGREYFVEGLVIAEAQDAVLHDVFETVMVPQLMGYVVPISWLITRKAHAEIERRYQDYMRKMRAQRIMPRSS